MNNQPKHFLNIFSFSKNIQLLSHFSTGKKKKKLWVATEGHQLGDRQQGTDAKGVAEIDGHNLSQQKNGRTFKMTFLYQMMFWSFIFKCLFYLFEDDSKNNKKKLVVFWQLHSFVNW